MKEVALYRTGRTTIKCTPKIGCIRQDDPRNGTDKATGVDHPGKRYKEEDEEENPNIK